MFDFFVSEVQVIELVEMFVWLFVFRCTDRDRVEMGFSLSWFDFSFVSIRGCLDISQVFLLGMIGKDEFRDVYWVLWGQFFFSLEGF